MNSVEFIVGKNTYNLRLNTRAIVNLEKKIGKNPLDIFTTLEKNSVPKTTDLMLLLHASMQQFNHGVKEEDCFDIYDDYLAEGHTLVDFMNVLLEVFKVSGFISDEEIKKVEEAKNG